MDKRIKFKPNKQKQFLNLVITQTNSTSLRGILQFGFDTTYSSLKNYYTERRLMPKTLFNNLCHLAKINPETLKTQELEKHWGQEKGGKSNN